MRLRDSPSCALSVVCFAMNKAISSVERAFELARPGHFENVEDVRRRLKEEGYLSQAVVGPSILAQLDALIKVARGSIRDDKKQT